MVSQDSTDNPDDLGLTESDLGPNLADLVGDILSIDNETKKEPDVSSKPTKHYKPKGLYLGERRDNGKPVDIAPQVLARHAAMLGSTGSGKTVMAKALIEELSLIHI